MRASSTADPDGSAGSGAGFRPTPDTLRVSTAVAGRRRVLACPGGRSGSRAVRDLKIAPATPVAHADFVLPASADPLQLFLNGSGRRVMPERLALMR